MTDKQIMIDETKCPWFNDGSCDLFYSDKEECWYRKCKDTPNCYYRETQTQLKAKEQECEELRTDIKDIANLLDLDTGEEYNFGNIEIAIKGLKQECEELKKQLIQKDEVNTFFNTPIEGWDNDPCKICESKQNYEQLKAENDKFKKHNEALLKWNKNLITTIKFNYREIKQAEQKLEKIRQICKCSKIQMNCEQCPMCDECEELCVNDENLQNIILQIIDEVE